MGTTQQSFVDEVSLRPGREADHGFALALYLESTKPLLAALGRWDEPGVLSRFSEGFRPDEISVLHISGVDIGWVQVTDKNEELHLDQLHLVTEVRNRGIGTHIVRQLQVRAANLDKAVALNVIRGNRAREFYTRLGFRTDGGDEEKERMVWRPPMADPCHLEQREPST